MSLARVAILISLGLAWTAPRALAQDALTLDVDAREAPRRIVHVTERVPARPGPMALVYPKWLPGEHGPTGPITDLVGLKLQVNGKPIPWQRDPVDMFRFQFEVPAGASGVDVAFDFVSPPVAEGFSSGAAMTPNVAVLAWNQAVLYPDGAASDAVQVKPRLRLPEGWAFATALDVTARPRDAVEFAPVSLTTLVDSPVLAGRHLRMIELAKAPAVRLNLAGESEEAVQIGEYEQRFKQLAAETEALFGAHHYEHYDFLYALSDGVAHFGLEHHQSSDNRTAERTLLDDDLKKTLVGLLPHEFVHSWNGKYRRPAELATPDFQKPMKGAAALGLRGADAVPRRSAHGPERPSDPGAGARATGAGRRLPRPSPGPQVEAAGGHGRGGAAPLRRSPRLGVVAARGGLLRRGHADLARGRHDHPPADRATGPWTTSASKFHGAPSGPPQVKTYTFDDVVAALNDIVPYDWKQHLESRVNSTGSRAPLAGLENSGWRLVYVDKAPDTLRAREEAGKFVDLTTSLGLVAKEDGFLLDVIPGMAAAKAGVGPAMKIVAINGRRFTPKVARAALALGKGKPEPVELIVQNGDFMTVHKLDYNDGERWPALERDPTRPDVLTAILSPRTWKPAAPAPPAPKKTEKGKERERDKEREREREKEKNKGQ